MKTLFTGSFGEKAACRALQKDGYRILARNYRKKYGEIDIIAQKDALICFVEVKTRSGTDYGTPAEAVTQEKQRKIILTAQAYIAEHNLDAAFSFDVIEVYLTGKKIRFIHHIKDAFST